MVEADVPIIVKSREQPVLGFSGGLLRFLELCAIEEVPVSTEMPIYDLGKVRTMRRVSNHTVLFVRCFADIHCSQIPATRPGKGQFVACRSVPVE